MKTKMSQISLAGEFENIDRLEEAFAEIIKQAREKKQSIKFINGGMTMKALIHDKMTESEAIRNYEEKHQVQLETRWDVIDGKSCLVIPSKMNFER